MEKLQSDAPQQVVLTCFLRNGDWISGKLPATLSLQEDIRFLRDSPDVSRLSVHPAATPAGENSARPKHSKPHTMHLMANSSPVLCREMNSEEGFAIPGDEQKTLDDSGVMVHCLKQSEEKC